MENFYPEISFLVHFENVAANVISGETILSREIIIEVTSALFFSSLETRTRLTLGICTVISSAARTDHAELQRTQVFALYC